MTHNRMSLQLIFFTGKKVNEMFYGSESKKNFKGIKGKFRELTSHFNKNLAVISSTVIYNLDVVFYFIFIVHLSLAA